MTSVSRSSSTTTDITVVAAEMRTIISNCYPLLTGLEC